MRVPAALTILLLLAAAVDVGGAELARRSFLGLQFDLADRSGPGLLVTGVASGSTAQQAGMRIGDRLTSVGSIVELDGYPELREELARTPVGSRLSLRWYRGANTVFRAAPSLGPLPAERVPGSRVRYDAIEVEGSALRMILTEPDANSTRLIFYLQGMSCDSVDFWQAPEHPVKRLIDGWAAQGFATARLEKRGVGDSEGAPCRDLDLAEELRGYRVALEHLSSLGYGGRVLLFGHGLGGVIASQIASNAVAAVLVFGTPEELSPEVLVRRQPEAATSPDVSAADGTYYLGRSVSYFAQLAGYDPERSWRQVWQPVLALHAEYDWLSSRRDAERIARFTGGKFQSLAGMGHDFLHYESAEEAFVAGGTGAFDPAIVDATVTWIRTLTGR